MEYHGKHPLDGYRRVTYMMLDADVVAVSSSTTYRGAGCRVTGSAQAEAVTERNRFRPAGGGPLAVAYGHIVSQRWRNVLLTCARCSTAGADTWSTGRSGSR